MKIKTLIKEEKTVVEQLRDIRDKISFEIKDLTLEQLKEYLSKQATLKGVAVWQQTI
jgi:hypothetical protein